MGRPNLTSKFKIGDKFSRLIIVETPFIENQISKALCRCDCGVTKIINLTNLKKTQSCGCMLLDYLKNNNPVRTTHNKTNTRVYCIYRGMLTRCSNKKAANYKNYGERGIKVCKAWLTNFDLFLTDVGEPPTRLHSLDRIDNNGHYSCGHCSECEVNNWKMNCQWSSSKQQARNKSNNLKLTYDNKTLTLSEWSEITGIKKTTLSERLKRGWNIAKTLSTPTITIKD